MFDFFKDVYLEAKGIDSDAIKKERLQIKNKTKEKKYIFSSKTKVLIIILGIVYFFISTASLSILKFQKDMIMLSIKFLILSIMDLAIITCLMIPKKKAEIIALIIIIVFVIITYFSIILL